MSIKKKIGLAIASTAIGATLIAAGTTALFTSEAKNEGNTFAAGTLQIELNKPNGTKYFDVCNLAPGDTGEVKIEVKNTGSLDLRYIIEEYVSGKLADADLDVNFYDANGNEIEENGPRNIAAGSSETITAKYELPRDTNNDFQNASGTVNIKVNAEQTANNPTSQLPNEDDQQD